MRNKIVVHKEYDDVSTESITCDICKKTYPGIYWGRPSCYDVLETEIKLRTGNSYPGGGMGEKVFFDICPKCFEEVLIPLLATVGAQPTKEDWDW